MDKKKDAVIFCGGKTEDYEFLKKYDLADRFIICADGGLKHCQKLNITPDLVIGDMDSFSDEYPKDIKSIVYPQEKDNTDTELCVDYAIEKGVEDILLVGGIGGRLDHEFSHYCIMKKALEKGVRVRSIDSRNEIFMTDKPIIIYREYLKKTDKKYISFFPFGGGVSGFSVNGLKYELNNASLDCGQTLTCSNEFSEAADTSECAEITFDKGYLLVMLTNDI